MPNSPSPSDSVICRRTRRSVRSTGGSLNTSGMVTRHHWVDASSAGTDFGYPGSDTSDTGVADTNRGMIARLLLVHSPLVGSGTWDLVAADRGDSPLRLRPPRDPRRA